MPSGSDLIVVIIPCAAVDALARRCVEHCLRLQYENFRVVLLPDEAPAEGPADSRLLTLPTGRITIAAKRNSGMRAFPQAGYFAFIDSDAYPETTWLTEALAAFRRAPADTWLIGGPNISPPDQSASAQVVGAAMRSVLLSGAGAFRKGRTASRYCRDLPACNLVARADAVARVQGFDEALVTGEDIDLCARMRARGGRTFFESKVCVFHQDRQLLLPFLRQRFVYGCSVWNLLRRDPDIHKAYLLCPFLFLGGLLVGPLLFAHALAYWFYLAVAGAFGLIALVESLRLGRMVYFPLTMLVFFLGAVVPGFGSAFALVRLPVDVGQVYRKSRNLA